MLCVTWWIDGFTPLTQYAWDGLDGSEMMDACFKACSSKLEHSMLKFTQQKKTVDNLFRFIHPICKISKAMSKETRKEMKREINKTLNQ